MHARAVKKATGTPFSIPWKTQKQKRNKKCP
jgi:hypothetical protein